MMEIKFTGESWEQIRENIQAFAVSHLLAKFDHPTTGEKLEVKNGYVQPVPPDMPSELLKNPEAFAPKSEVASNPELAPKAKPGPKPKIKLRPAKVEAAKASYIPTPDVAVKAAETELKVQPPSDVPENLPKPTLAAVPEAEKPLSQERPDSAPEHVNQALIRVVQLHGRDRGFALLQEFGAERARQLFPYQYEDFVKRCKAQTENQTENLD